MDSKLTKDIADITAKHGQVMYEVALESAIRIVELWGDDALPILKAKLARERQDSGDDNAEK